MPKPAQAAALAVGLLVALATVAHADSPRRIEVAPWCSRTADRIGFHLAFVDGQRRTVVNLTCDLKSRACTGAMLELSRLDRGEPLGAMALGAISGARLADGGTQPNGIRWGTHALVLDSDARFATFDGVRSACQ